jgi:hypothetical protein
MTADSCGSPENQASAIMARLRLTGRVNRDAIDVMQCGVERSFFSDSG